MKKFFFSSLFLVLVSAGNASAQWWFCEECSLSMPNASSEDMVLFVLPDGSGSPLTQAQVKNDGSLRDAHIELILRDYIGEPVVDYPAEDMWLESDDGGMIPCIGGAIADQNTEDAGFTHWTRPLRAGGHSESPLRVFVNGMALPFAPFTLAIVSADMNGDGAVNLVDVSLFSNHFYGGYDFAADYFADGVLNLLDVGRLALGLGGSCP